VPTHSVKVSEIERAWHVVDAEGMVLGRLATEVARILRGKHKPTFTPHLDVGDHVIIVNASKVVLTSDKGSKKVIYRHSGYPGGLRETLYGNALGREAGRDGAAHRQRNVAAQSARSSDDPKAQGLRGARASPHCATAADNHVRTRPREVRLKAVRSSRCPNPSSNPPAGARRQSPACVSAPAAARS
jgi:hypothetical protein